MGNGNSSISKSRVHCQPTKREVVGFPTHEGRGINGAAFRGEYVNKPKVETDYGLRVYSEHHGMKSLENDDAFTEYIRRTKQNIRTVSYIGQEYSNPAPVAAPDVANGTSNKENQNEQYSEHHGMKSLENDDAFIEYIRRTKQNIRTVSYIGQEYSNPAPVAAPDVANGTSNKENQNDQFSEFIKLTKKKLSTTSRIGENGSFQRG